MDSYRFNGQKAQQLRRVLSEETARLATLFLADPMARLPEFPRLGSLEYPFPVAVKTGTSSRFRDAWAVAFTSRYVVGAWVGDPDFRPMNHVSGAEAEAALAQRLLRRLHPDEAHGLADLSFPPPRGHRPARLCALTGALATPACEQVSSEWLRPGDEPRHECAAHRRILVDARTGRPAGRETPRAFLEARTFVDLPPRYAAWAAAAGLPRPPTLEPQLVFASFRPSVRVRKLARVRVIVSGGLKRTVRRGGVVNILDVAAKAFVVPGACRVPEFTVIVSCQGFPAASVNGTT